MKGRGNRGKEDLLREQTQFDSRQVMMGSRKKGTGKLTDLVALAAAAAAVVLFLLPLLFLGKAPDLSDIRTYYYPGWTYLGKALGNGSPEYWCPHLYCGFPLFADSELGPFYPLNRLLWLLPPLGGLVASLLVHYLMAAFFTYAYARRMGLSPLPSLVPTVSFSLGGVMAAHLVHPNMIWAAAYLPLFLLLLEMGLAGSSPSPFLGISLVVGLQYLAGFLMIPLMEALIVPVYLVIHAWKEIEKGRRVGFFVRNAAYLVAAFILGTALGAVQNLPSYHLVKESYRAGGLDQGLANVGSLPPLQLLGLLFPRAFGRGIAQGGYVGAWTFEETYSYVGTLPILLLPFALRRPRRRPVILFSTLGLLFLILSLGNTGLLWQLVRRLPGLHVLKGSSRFMLVSGLSLSMLGGLGLQDFTESKGFIQDGGKSPIGKEKAWMTGYLAAMLAGTILIVILQADPLHFRRFLAPIAGSLKGAIPASPERIVQDLSRYFSLAHPEFLLPFAAGALLLVLRRFLALHPRRAGRFRLALAVFAIVDVMAFSAMLFPFPARSTAERVPSVVEYLSTNSGGRTGLLTEEGVPPGEYRLAPNRLLLRGVYYASGFSTIPPLRMDRFLSLAKGHRRENAHRLLGVENLLSELVSVRGTSFDLSLGLGSSGWCDGEMLLLPSSDPRRLCLLLAGDLFDRSLGGKWHLILQPSVGEPFRVSLEKRPGDDLPEVVADDPAGCATVQEIAFRSPGYGRGRRGLFLEIDLGGVKTGDRLGLLFFGSPARPGVRLLGISEITATGRCFPLLPYELSYADGRYALFRPTWKVEEVRALKRIEWCGGWEEAAREALVEGDFDTAWLVEGEVGPASREILDRVRESGDRPILQATKGPSRMEVSTNSAEPFVLVISQNFMKGWRAFLDGERVGAFSVYGALTGVAVPAGEHRVVLEYDPPGLKAGARITLGTLVVLSILAALVYINPRYRRKGEGDGLEG